MYATWWSTYFQGFSASIFPDWGRTYVSDIYHCYIHYFSLLSKERKNLNFNITVIFLPLTIFSLFFALLQRRERFRKQKQDLKRFETHLFITIFLSSREYKGQCSGGDQDEDRESIVYNSYYQVVENSPIQFHITNKIDNTGFKNINTSLIIWCLSTWLSRTSFCTQKEPTASICHWSTRKVTDAIFSH